ncbi:hypothetical protein HMPREF9240_01831 [Winkia neuii BV029A5]|uniref:Uncharacterized protein n=1 Tax=Winkia neuii BV029A5 TaxID=888439 RepID=K0YZZ4_9ACTO|nr:hypothetical protein HMPREF9240_01831 [Winkia neuii BV029A5]
MTPSTADRTVTRTCAGCGQPIQLTETSSLYQTDGTPWPVYHADCYQNKNNQENHK